jgi:hypothetical protein
MGKDIIHFEEIPEMFIPYHIAEKFIINLTEPINI